MTERLEEDEEEEEKERKKKRNRKRRKRDDNCGEGVKGGKAAFERSIVEKDDSGDTIKSEANSDVTSKPRGRYDSGDGGGSEVGSEVGSVIVDDVADAKNPYLSVPKPKRYRRSKAAIKSDLEKTECMICGDRASGCHYRCVAPFVGVCVCVCVCGCVGV